MTDVVHDPTAEPAAEAADGAVEFPDPARMARESYLMLVGLHLKLDQVIDSLAQMRAAEENRVRTERSDSGNTYIILPQMGDTA